MISYPQYLQFSPYFAQEDIEKPEDRVKFFKSFDASPQTVKNLLTSMEITEKIINACKAFGLDEFDTEATSLVIRKIATGEILVGDGVDFMVTETETPREKATNLFSLIVNEILASAIDDIKKIQTVKLSGGSSQTPKPVQTQSTQIRPERPDLKIDPGVNKNNIVDLRNRQN